MEIWLLLSMISGILGDYSHWLPPFNDGRRIYQLCTREMDRLVLHHRGMDRSIDFYIKNYLLCYTDYEKFVSAKYRGIVWLMRALKFCEVNQIMQNNRNMKRYDRHFQKRFLRYSYALVCDKGALLPKREATNLYVYSSIFKMLYEAQNSERTLICNTVSNVYADLYSRCYVPHVEKRQEKIRQRCSSTTAPLLKFSAVFQRFSRNCTSLVQFLSSKSVDSHRVGASLANDTLFMNILSSNLLANIHADSELPSLVLKTRLLLQHFSLAAVKLYRQLEDYKMCRQRVLNEVAFTNETSDDDKGDSLVISNCCNGSHICDLQGEKRFKALSDRAWFGFKIEISLLIFVSLHTVLLGCLLIKTRRLLSTATVLFVFNIMFSNMLFLLSFIFLFLDLVDHEPYGPVNEEFHDKSAELVVAETLQTHLFAAVEFRKHLIQETLFSLAQNGSLIGLILLLVLVLVVINRSMAGSTVRVSRVAVIALFTGVWFFLIATHVAFSGLQITAIQNLDQLFLTLSKGRIHHICDSEPKSSYSEIARQCDKTAVFHAFGAYLLRGHTLFTLVFLVVSLVIFTATIIHHYKVRKEYELIQIGLREQTPHKRRERLFHTLILSIATFFVSILGQTFIEIAVFWVEDRGDVAKLTKWYHMARLAAFVDPVLNPLVVVARTPALRRQLRAQWTSLRSRTSIKRSGGGNEENVPQRSHSIKENKENEVRRPERRTRSRSLVRRGSNRRSGDSQTHSVV